MNPEPPWYLSDSDLSTIGSEATGTVRVLHVDDEPDVLDLTSTYLERESDALSVTTTTDPTAALERARTGAVDCVVSDYRMPGTDGIALLEAVREESPELPFILYTGEGSEAVASEAISKGVTEYLQKETGTSQYAVLANRIENAVERHRASTQVERGFRAIETAREGFSILDESGHIVYVNDAYTEIVGYDRAQLIGQHWKLLYPEADVHSVREDILPNVPENGRWTGETVYVRSDGERILVDHAMARTGDGALVCLIRDMTHDDGGERPLVGEEAFVECMLDALDDVFYVLDTGGEILRVNERVTERTGFTTDEITSMHAIEAVAEEDHDAVVSAVDETLAEGSSTVEASLVTTDGRTVPHEFRTRRLTDPTGTAIGLVGIGRDVTERNRRERQLERQATQFEAFGSVLSHDMRNPLTVLRARTELLGDELDDEALLEHVTTMDRTVDRLEALIDDMAGVMREGDLAAEKDAVDVGSVARDAWEALDPTDATLVVEDAVQVRADQQALTRLFDNLLVNALEHAGSDATVRIGRLPAGFYVADDGPGVPPGDRETVFEPGYSLADDGTGFGLASVRQIALAHGWDVSVTESETGGARLEVTDVTVVE